MRNPPTLTQLVVPAAVTNVPGVETPSCLLPLLRSRVTGALLALLYLHPERAYSLAEAGRLVSASSQVMSAEADLLVTSGLVLDRRRGRLRLIRAKTTGPVAGPLRDLLAVTYGPLPVLSDLLSGVAGIDAAYLYGSWAARYSGEAGEVPRDVNVLVVGSADPDELYDAVETAERTLGREVSISSVSAGYWAEPNRADVFMRHLREHPLVQLQPGHSPDGAVPGDAAPGGVVASGEQAPS